MELDTLLAQREIEYKLIAFARAMDARDWPAIEALTTADFCADFGLGEIQGRALVIQNMRSYLDHCGVTQHLLGNILVNVEGDLATSHAYVADMHLAAEATQELSFRTLGDYTDTWRKVDGAWLMTRREKDNRALIGSMDVFKPPA